VRSRGFPQLRSLIQNIETILIGRAANQLSIENFDTTTTIVRLPLWSELRPEINVGVKLVKNEDLVLPARIEWSITPVVLLAPGQTVDASWRITNMGHNLSGSVIVSSSGLSSHIPGQLDTVSLEAFGPRDLRRKLDGLITLGASAKWLILQSFETYTRSKLDEANRILAQELSEHYGQSIPGVLDDIALDELLTHMLFGEGDTSIVSRMVDKALQPDAFKTFDPARYFTLNLKSRALGEVRRTVGDPHIGPKIRRLQKQVGATDVDALVSAYNEQYPKENLGKKRAAAALTVGPAIGIFAVALVTDEELRAYSGRRGSSGVA
jgi:hypothetical protein